MVVPLPSKQIVWVRFPSFAQKGFIITKGGFMNNEEDIELYKKEFKEKKYTKLKNVLTERESKLICNLLNFEYNFNRQSGDDLVLNTHAGNHPIFDSLMLILKPLVEDVTGKKLYPTYGYHRVYRSGARLPLHKDRFSCEISLNLCVGYFYDTENDEYKWNIFMDDTEIETDIGDLIIYKGLEVKHWRNTFVGGKNSWQTQIFLHYVDADGQYSDYKWDGRQNFGTYSGIRKLPEGRATW
jgi:hypothetical protein